MYDAGRASGVAGELFVVLVMLVTWLIMLNLFLSILVVRCVRVLLLAARTRLTCLLGVAVGH
jgi:hypothetical protein